MVLEQTAINTLLFQHPWEQTNRTGRTAKQKRPSWNIASWRWRFVLCSSQELFINLMSAYDLKKRQLECNFKNLGTIANHITMYCISISNRLVYFIIFDLNDFFMKTKESDLDALKFIELRWARERQSELKVILKSHVLFASPEWPLCKVHLFSYLQDYRTSIAKLACIFQISLGCLWNQAACLDALNQF